MIGKRVLFAGRVAPAIGMPVCIASHKVGSLVNPKGRIVKLREPLGTVDIELNGGAIRYCVSSDPYAIGVYWYHDDPADYPDPEPVPE